MQRITITAELLAASVSRQLADGIDPLPSQVLR